MMQDIRAAQEMGFSSDVIDRAKKVFKNGHNFIELCLEVQMQDQQRKPPPSKPIQPNAGYDDMPPNLPQLKHKTSSYQHHSQINYEEDYDLLDYIRIQDCPIGLINIGNTCYFNSLIQSYFKNPQFCKLILSYRYPSNFNMAKLQDYIGETKSKRVIASINLVVHLQRLFSFLLLSDKRFYNPSSVFKNIVNSQGERYKIGEQQDIGEFNLNFISRIEEALIYHYDNIPHLEVKWLSSQITSQIQDESASTQLSQSIASCPSSTKEEERDSRMKQMFFGKRTQVSTYIEEGNEVVNKEVMEFNSIYLQLESKELMNAWEESRFSVVDDFRNSLGEIVQSQQSFWISQIPEVLLFQIQRTSYDTATNSVQKLHSEFLFDKEIFVDRFLECNQAQYLLLKSQLQALKLKKNELSEKLEALNNFNKSTLGIVDLISLVQMYFQDNASSSNPVPVNLLLEKQLEDEKNKCVEQIESLQEELKNIKEKEESLFESMKKEKYSLQTILIHQGSNAGFGHYFSFVFDFHQKKWLKYDDINCFEVDEADVMRYSRGYGDQSAYGLIYVSQRLCQQMTITPYIEQAMGIPQNLKEEIVKDNKQFQTDLVQRKEEGKLIGALKEYQERIIAVDQYVRNYCQRKDLDRTNPCLTNFAAFILHQGSIGLAKLHILDVALRTKISQSFSLHDLLKDPKLVQKIKTQMESMSLHQSQRCPMGFQSKDVHSIDIKYSEFITTLKLQVGIRSTIEDAIAGNYESCLAAIPHLMLLNSFKQPFFISLTDWMLGIVLIASSFSLFDNIKDTAANVIIERVKLISKSSKLLPKNLEYLYKQIKIVLSDFGSITEGIFDKDTNKNLQEALKIIGDNKQESLPVLTAVPHKKLDSLFEEIERGMEKLYCWENNQPLQDPNLNNLIMSQKKFNDKFKLQQSIFSYIIENKVTLSFKERVLKNLHCDPKK